MPDHSHSGPEEPASGAFLHVIPEIGVAILKSEVVKDDAIGEDRWVRYTVQDENGREHCVGTRLHSLVRERDYEALDRHRRQQFGVAAAAPIGRRELKNLERERNA